MRVSTGAALLFVAAGCMDPTSSGGVAREAFPAAIARANCELLFECCASAAEVSAFTPGLSVANEAECRSYFEMIFASEGMLLDGYVELGRVRWDDVAAGVCVASVAEATCADLPDVLAIGRARTSADAPCGRTTVGLGVDGATCGSAIECASAYCAEGMTRACAPRPGVGEPCTDTCAVSLYCDTSLESPACTTLLPDGSACAPGSDGACASRYCSSSVCTERPPLTYCTGAMP